jgi:hypothetical protein
MAYGVKRGVKAPGEYGIADILGLGLAGAAGIVAALVTDYQQQGASSALYTLNHWASALGKLMGIGDIPLWFVVVGLLAAGAGSIFYFQPITRQGAFAQGFGLLAVLMTAVPADLGNSLLAIDNGELPGLEPAAFSREASLTNGDARGRIMPASYTPGEARLYQAQQARAAKYDVVITINFPNGIPSGTRELTGRLYNAQTGAKYDLFRTMGGSMQRNGDTIVIHAGVPAREDQATLWVRIECPGYAIEEQSAEATLGQTLDWQIDMQPSSTPLFIQRLRKSYWF